jgi:hypothetical protein
MSTAETPLPSKVTHKVIRLEDMLPWVHQRQFKDCAIVGPSPALLSGCHIEGSTWLGVSPASFIVIDDPTDPSKLPQGTIVFVDCRFLDCEFQNFTVVGSREQIDALRDAFGLIEANA